MLPGFKYMAIRVEVKIRLPKIANGPWRTGGDCEPKILRLLIELNMKIAEQINARNNGLTFSMTSAESHRAKGRMTQT